ncbi:hypothetical protein Taro_054033, partial [Colocasia esculenta]|nr:hypothetical protein [Colocasia esculenta]
GLSHYQGQTETESPPFFGHFLGQTALQSGAPHPPHPTFKVKGLETYLLGPDRFVLVARHRYGLLLHRHGRGSLRGRRRAPLTWLPEPDGFLPSPPPAIAALAFSATLHRQSPRGERGSLEREGDRRVREEGERERELAGPTKSHQNIESTVKSLSIAHGPLSGRIVSCSRRYAWYVSRSSSSLGGSAWVAHALHKASELRTACSSSGFPKRRFFTGGRCDGGSTLILGFPICR